MKNLLSVSKTIYDFPDEVIIPDECNNEVIFIPAIAAKCNHYYYLIDYCRRKITCWNVNLNAIKDRLKSQLNIHSIKTLPWNYQNLDDYLETLFFAHSASYYEGNIYVSCIAGNCIIALGVEDNSYDLIYDEQDITKMYSSTNDIYDGCIYFTRWKIDDTFKHAEDANHAIYIDVGRYNIKNKCFEVFDTIEGADDIHHTCTTKDGKNILILEMRQDPIIKYPVDTDNASAELMREILKAGLKKSKLITYNIEKREYDTIIMEGSPAHIEFDLYDENTIYIIEHYNSPNKNSIMSFGNVKFNKVQIENNKSKVIERFSVEGMYRSPSHKLAIADNKQLIFCPSYPNQSFIIDPKGKNVYKKLSFVKKNATVDFSNGPVKYPNPPYDKTPFTIYPVENSPYMILCSIWNTTIYNFMDEAKVSSLIYNIESNPLIGMGHASKFILE